MYTEVVGFFLTVCRKVQCKYEKCCCSWSAAKLTMQDYSTCVVVVTHHLPESRSSRWVLLTFVVRSGRNRGVGVAGVQWW